MYDNDVQEYLFQDFENQYPWVWGSCNRWGSSGLIVNISDFLKLYFLTIGCLASP